jgi:SAM-dependent methyltransferase
MTTETPSPPCRIGPERAWAKHPRIGLFLISFSILFLELACIRWFGSTVLYLTFFTNIVLMACVLGMSVGCLAATRRQDLVQGVMPLTLLAVALALGTLWAHRERRMDVDVGNQASPQQIYFGTETPSLGGLRGGVPIEVIAGLFFLLIALLFVGLGQVMGRAFDAIPDRVAAYTTNIAGNLVGIVAFSLLAYARVSPAVWFAVALGPLLWFTGRWAGLHALALAAVLVLVGPFPAHEHAEGLTIWSPYYRVYFDSNSNLIVTNNIGHQQMVPIGINGSGYALPYLLNRDADGPPRRDVLIIGAGSGNDVQAALESGARHVDAVEIDPVLYEIGRARHPERPYDDPRVTIHLDDGRNFVRKARSDCDQIVYALVDSLVLHSGYSSLRLESFLFTEQAFRDIRERLRPDGVFVMYNQFRQGWVVARLARMAERAFGTRPIVLSLPFRDKIGFDQSQQGYMTVVIVGRTEAAVAPIRRRFERGEWFWLNPSPEHNETINAFGPRAPHVPDVQDGHWQKIGPARVDVAAVRWVPTDDWPLLYLRSPMIPAHNLRGILIMVAASLVVLRLFAPSRSFRPNGQMFFLGAGFMLLETKAVVHLALLFGSTWIVHSIAFFAILAMILLSNLYVIAVRPRRTRLYYGLLLASLLANAAVPMTGLLALSTTARVLASCALISAPIFFAGVIFATALRDSPHPDLDLGSNIGGVVLGGLSEYLSLVVGFRGLLLVACAYYLLSALLSRRRPSG